MAERPLSPLPRSYTVFRAVVGVLVLAVGAAAGWMLWTWLLPLIGIDLAEIIAQLF